MRILNSNKFSIVLAILAGIALGIGFLPDSALTKLTGHTTAALNTLLLTLDPNADGSPSDGSPGFLSVSINGEPLINQSDCSGITSGWCRDSDDGKIYSWDGAASPVLVGQYLEAGVDYLEPAGDGTGLTLAIGDCTTGDCTADEILDDEDISPTGGTWDLSLLTLTLPTPWMITGGSTVPTVEGEIRWINDAAGLEDGTHAHYDGDEVKYWLEYPVLPTVTGQFLRYNATTDDWEQYTPVETEYIPIAYAVDGGTAPAALATINATAGYVDTRAFDGASQDEDVMIVWQAPIDLDATSGIKFRVICYIVSSTAPSSETWQFEIAGFSLGDGDALAGTLGTAQTSNSGSRSDAQYDRVSTAWSSALTSTHITDLAAGETVHLKLYRDIDDTDTYAQDVGVAGVEIKYKRTLTGAF